jgi:hypothetical protein
MMLEMVTIYRWFGTNKNFIQNHYSSKLYITSIFGEENR